MKEKWRGKGKEKGISGGVSSVFQAKIHLNHAFHTCQRAAPGILQKPLGILVFLHAPSKWASYAYRQNLTLIEKPV